MPCPFFEPRQLASPATRQHARLPLIEEYDGVCSACAENPEWPVKDTAIRLRLCNQGNARGECSRFPAGEKRSSIRFHVLARSASQLDLLCIEESFYAPLAWRRLAFEFEGERIGEADGNAPLDRAARAQLIAFCRSYLRRNPELATQ